jgi:hypothetical protein
MNKKRFTIVIILLLLGAGGIAAAHYGPTLYCKASYALAGTSPHVNWFGQHEQCINFPLTVVYFSPPLVKPAPSRGGAGPR